jgi:hypothetical protein
MLGGQPADEEQLPIHQENCQPPMCDFYGLGQPGQAPFHQQLNDDLESQEADNHRVDQTGWDNWVQEDVQGNDGMVRWSYTP